jgi:uncharacterized RDD family membrane protein YckC
LNPTSAGAAAGSRGPDPQGPELRRQEIRDVRDRVTPHAFGVDDELLGLPLAGHGRRVAAILVDLVLVALLSNAGGVLLGVAAAVLLLRVALRTRPDQTPSLTRTAFQGSMGCMGALIVFVLIVSLWGTGQRLFRPAPPEVAERAALGGAPELSSFVGGLREVAAVRGAETPEELEERALVLAGRLREMGLTAEEAGEVATELAGSLARPSALAGAPRSGPGAAWVPPDRWWQEWAALSAQAGDPSSTDPLAPGSDTLPGTVDPALLEAPTLDSATAARLEALSDSVAALQTRLERERSDRARAETALVAAERRAEGGRIRRWLSGMAEDLGLGLGWGALYFTVSLTWWKGRTPGKRLLGLRVVRLNGRPITWWCAFERYGGYAAGFATGLLGFAQVYWDANRQATHDKISGTVVIRDGAPRLPLPRALQPEPTLDRPDERTDPPAGAPATPRPPTPEGDA